jgi:hypothetical protein
MTQGLSKPGPCDRSPREIGFDWSPAEISQNYAVKKGLTMTVEEGGRWGRSPPQGRDRRVTSASMGGREVRDGGKAER